MNLPRIQSAVFLGSKPFGLAILNSLVAAEPSLEWTIIHPDDSADPRSNYDAYKLFSKSNGISLKLVRNRMEAETALAELSYDIAFVCGWYWLLADYIVSNKAPPVFGIHNSLLPRYRGGAPLVWSILNGEGEVGGTLFRLSSGMDDGDIILQVKVAVEQNSTVGMLLDAIEARFLKAIPLAWKNIVSGRTNSTSQDHTQASYYAQRRPEDGLIDWFDTAQNIHNFIRAQSSPYPCAFTFCGGKKVHIDRAEVCYASYYGQPGEIVDRISSHVIVTTGAGGALRIMEAHNINGESNLRAIFHSEVCMLRHHQKGVCS